MLTELSCSTRTEKNLERKWALPLLVPSYRLKFPGPRDGSPLPGQGHSSRTLRRSSPSAPAGSPSTCKFRQHLTVPPEQKGSSGTVLFQPNRSERTLYANDVRDRRLTGQVPATVLGHRTWSWSPCISNLTFAGRGTRTRYLTACSPAGTPSPYSVPVHI